jgi:HPt (histidine-containing phosphotransfer) domain-containing protein
VNPSQAGAVLDLRQLRNITLDDERLMRELVHALIEDTSLQMSRMAEAIETGDPQACIRLAHYSKGACANVGAVSAAGLLAEIESGARHEDFAGCRASLLTLIGELERLRQQARSL